MKRRWTKLWMRLMPPALREQISAADTELDVARARFARVVEQDQDVNRLVAAHSRDRIVNGYGQRVATALGGRTWT